MRNRVKRHIQYPWKVLSLEGVPLVILTLAFVLIGCQNLTNGQIWGVIAGVSGSIAAFGWIITHFLFKRWSKNEAARLKTQEMPYSSKQEKLSLFISVLFTIVLPTSVIIALTILHCLGKWATSGHLGWYIAAASVWVIYAAFMLKGLGTVVVDKIEYGLNHDYQPKTKLSARLHAAFSRLEKSSAMQAEEWREVQALSIPVPTNRGEESASPIGEYLKEISNLGKSHPEMASLEQFILNVAHFPNLEGWQDSLRDVLSSGVGVASASQHLVEDTVKSFGHFVVSPDKSTWGTLCNNVLERLNDSGHSKLFRLKLYHAHGPGGIFGTSAKEFGKDAGLGAFDTFKPEDGFENIGNAFDAFKSSFHDFAEHFSPEFDVADVDVFEPDFDFTAHFPVISSVKEAFVNFGRMADGDVDMASSMFHSATKVAGRAGGAYAGGVIGSFFCPGIGTAIGSMLGAWAGGWLANRSNRQEFECLKQEFEDQKKVLEQTADSCRRALETEQIVIEENIKTIAQQEQQSFDKSKVKYPYVSRDNRFFVVAFGTVLYDIIWDIAETYSLRSKTPDKAKYNALLNLLPNNDLFGKNTFEAYSIRDSISMTRPLFQRGEVESLYYMIDGLISLIKKWRIRLPYYYNLSEIVDMFISMVDNAILVGRIEHVGWLSQVQSDYVRSTANILTKSESRLNEFKNFVEAEQRKVSVEADKCSELAKRAEAERKTL